MKKAIMPMSDYKNACDQIREITGETQAITSDKLVPEIKKVQQAAEAAGETKGYASGYSKGKTDGRAEVVAESNQTTIDEAKALEGETFFKNGEIKTGNIKKAVGGITAAAEAYESTINEKAAVAVQYTPVEPTYIAPALGGITLKAELDKFGDAEAADVAKGKTFTSKDGLKKVGTKEENAGGSSDTYGVEEMLTRFPFLRKVEWITTANSMDDYYGNWENHNAGFGGAITYQFTDTYDQAPLAIVLPWVTEIQEDTLSYIKCDTKQDGINYTTIIFLPKTPPVVGWQGNWSSDGGNYPPSVIFVPDESLEAYKNTTNLAEFADRMKPLSEYNGEGYYGGKL